jgi:hypothetical protein
VNPAVAENVSKRLCGPNVIAVEGVVLSAGRRDMGKQMIADKLTLAAQLGHSATEVNGIPEDYTATV